MTDRNMMPCVHSARSVRWQTRHGPAVCLTAVAFGGPMKTSPLGAGRSKRKGCTHQGIAGPRAMATPARKLQEGITCKGCKGCG